jgi:uncharacterized protein YbaR (Trm112 family)
MHLSDDDIEALVQRYTARPDYLSPNLSNKVCPYCNHPLMRIDHYGEVLIGCIDCNRWGRPDNKKLIMEMLEDDLDALRASVRRKHLPH